MAVLALALVVSSPVADAARAFFVFGDSLVDNGNNNYLATTARADAPPYGIDYPTHRATGRFSNGLNIPDIISEHIGGDPTLPYLSPMLAGSRLLNGANFASAGVGILNDTGIQFVNMIRITQQLEYFKQYQQRLASLIGEQDASRLVKTSLVLITLGGNDFVNNYYLIPFSVRSRQFSLPDYVTYLISEYKKILMTLHQLGARRVLVTGTGPLGCVPARLAESSIDGTCESELQRAASLFNSRLAQIIKSLNANYGADVFVAANAFNMHMDFITDPKAHGFVTSTMACCGQGAYNGVGLCTMASNLCPRREDNVFWDAYHPTEKANRIIVSRFVAGSLDYMHPMNLSTIMDLDSKLL